MIDVMLFWWKMGIKLCIILLIVESYVLNLACLSKPFFLCMPYQFSNLILSWAWLDIRGFDWLLRGNFELGLYFKVGWFLDPC